MAVTGAGRAVVWVTVTVTGLTAVGLVLLAVLGNLDTAGQAASVAGAVVSLAGLLVSVVALFRTSAGGGSRVRAGRGAIAVGGDITGSALGRNSRVTSPSSAPRSTAAGARDGGEVRAERDGIAAGGHVTDSALGEGSER